MTMKLSYPPSISPPDDDRLTALTDALRQERVLVEKVVDVLRWQRDGVASDDLQTVQDSVYATHRVLATLEQARRRRVTALRQAGLTGKAVLEESGEVPGSVPGTGLVEARDALVRAGAVLSREVDANRRVLRQAIAGSEERLRKAVGAPDTRLIYSESTRHPTAERSRGGALINRTA